MALGRIGQAAAWPLIEVLDVFAEFLFVLRQFARVLAHLFHLLGELVGCLLAEFIAHFLQILLRLCAVGQRLGDFAFLQLIGRLVHLLSGLFKLLARLLHLRAVLLVVHPLGELVGVLNVLLLLIAQLLELAADFLLLCLRLGLAQGLLHLL